MHKVILLILIIILLNINVKSNEIQENFRIPLSSKKSRWWWLTA